MKLLKIPGKVLLTLIYPILRIPLSQLDQLSGERTGFFEGIKNIWTDEPEEKDKHNV
jgi:hypothetical protein